MPRIRRSMAFPDPDKPTNLSSILAARLRELRARRGFTQDQVAKALKVHESAVSRWEGGSRFPTGEDLLKLADLFQVSIDTLFGRSEQFVPAGCVLLDQPLLSRLERAKDTEEFDKLVTEHQGHAIWLPVPDGAVLLPVAEAMRRTHRVAEQHKGSAYADRLFRPRF
jgi:transcriptional regulator with XRE-family HTH domain